MKIYAKDLAKNLSALDRFHRVLLFGPDDSAILYSEAQVIRALKKLGEYSVIKHDFKEVRANPHNIIEQLAEVSMFGDRKVVVVTGVPANANKEFVEVVQSSKGPNFLIIVAGDLKPQANLRKALEGDAASLAVACYKEDARDLSSFLLETLKAKGVKFEPAVVALLLERLPASKFLIEAEVERIALYLGDEVLSYETLEEVAADSGEANSDVLFQSIIKGDGERVALLLDRSIKEGVNFMMLLRSLLRNFGKLEEIHALAQEYGIAPAAAVEKISPPIFFKLKPLYLEASQKIKLKSCQRVIKQLCMLELECKTSNLNQDLLLGQKIYQLTAAIKR